MTSLSHAEAVLGYETLEDPSLYYKVRASDGSYLRDLDDHALHGRHGRDGRRQARRRLRLRQGGRRGLGRRARTGRPPSQRSSKLEFGETVKVVKGRDLDGPRTTSTRCSR